MEIFNPEEKIQSNNPPKGKGFKGKVLPIILTSTGLAIVLLLIGVGALLASHTWDPSWNPFKKPNPEKVISVKAIGQKIFKK